jgi:Protein of unknown function (DUF1592)/Protein of unknown function (DUF1595)
MAPSAIASVAQASPCNDRCERSHSPPLPPSGGGTSGGGDSCDPAVIAPQRVVLTSELAYANAIRDLLGDGALGSATFIPTEQSRTLDSDYVNQIDAKSLSTRYGYVTSAGEHVAVDAASVTRCAPGQSDSDCARSFAEAFAERAFRRPVESTELDDLMGIYQAGAAAVGVDAGAAGVDAGAAVTSHAEGIKMLTEAVLFAPSAMYRREIGGPAAPGKTAPLTSSEVADQLAAFFLDSTPDENLAAAARSNQLVTDADVRAQVNRLLGTERARKTVSQTMLAWLQASRIFDTVKDPKFAEFPAVQNSMYVETQMFVDEMLWTHPAPMTRVITFQYSPGNNHVSFQVEAARLPWGPAHRIRANLGRGRRLRAEHALSSKNRRPHRSIRRCSASLRTSAEG